jgi:adenylate cyclase 9
MAASGMNPYIRNENAHKYQHLHELVEFVFELQRSVSDFNQSLIEFDLILRIGFNFGDVTAGVIGTTKLYYDIWCRFHLTSFSFSEKFSANQLSNNFGQNFIQT